MRVCICLVALAFAQATHAVRAEVAVRVVDPSGAGVPDANVVMLDQSGQQVGRGLTSAAGEFKFDGTPHEAEVSAAGFRDRTVAVAGKRQVVVALELAPVVDDIEIVGEEVVVATIASDLVEPGVAAPPDLVESLRSTPNVHVLRRGGINFEPVVQGLRETQLAMVVDGTRTFAAGPARMDSELSHIDPRNVETVEVVTGPYALTEGAGAMAAILVHSAHPVIGEEWRLDGRTGAGWRSNGSWRSATARVDIGRSDIGFGLRAAGDLLDDYRAGGAGLGGGAVVPSDAGKHQFGANFRFSPTARDEITAEGTYDEQTGVDYPGRLLTAEHFLLRSWQASYRRTNEDSLLSGIKLVGYMTKKSHRMSNREKPTAMDMPGRKPPFALDVSLPAESDSVGGAGRLELSPGESWDVQAGFDFFRLEQDAQRFIARASNRKLIFSDAVWADTSMSDLGLYFSAGRGFNRGEIRAAGRLDFVRSAAGRPTAFFLENVSGDLDRREANPSFSVAGRYELGRGFTVAAGTGRVVRSANALERYSDRFPSTRFQVAAEFMGNPAIRPESSLQGDLNLQWKAGGFQVSAGGFVRSIGDYITVQPDGSLKKRLPLSPPVVFRYINGDSARFRGWTAGFRWAGGRIEIRSQAAKTIADDRELMEPVLGIAPMELNSAIRYGAASGRYWAEFGTRNVWDQRRVSAARMETGSPGFSLHRIRLGMELSRRVPTQLHVGIENLGDKSYYEHLNSLNPFTRQRIPELGRTLVVGLVTSW